jgi:hypothetical protein
MAKVATSQEDRLEQAKIKQARDMANRERSLNAIAKTVTSPPTSPATVPTTPAAKPGDQKAVIAPVSGDQKSVPTKAKKKPSATVIRWHQITKEKLYTSGTITLTDKGRGNKPKIRGALDRFKLYTDGMSVQDYIAKSAASGNSKALAQADIRWDVAAGLITVK